MRTPATSIALALLLGTSTSATAIERIHVAVGSLVQPVAGDGALVADGIDATLQLSRPAHTRVDVDIAHLQLPTSLAQYTGPLSNVRLHCDGAVIREPGFSCPQLALALRTPRWPRPLVLSGHMAVDSHSGQAQVTGDIPGIAGSTLALDLLQDATGRLHATLALPAVPLSQLAQLGAPWLTLPTDFVLQGNAHFDARIEQQGQQLLGTLAGRFDGVAFQDADGNWIGEGLSATLTTTADLLAEPLSLQLQATGDAGQVLAGVVLLDLARNPLQLQASAHLEGDEVVVEALQASQRDLVQLAASARLRVEPFSVVHLALDVPELRFPDAYGSYLQLLAATGPFGQLVTSGTASARVVVEDDQPTTLDLQLSALELRDDAQALDVQGMDAELYWRAGSTGPPRPSYLGWRSARGWGIEGGATRIDFAVDDRNFRLLQPARLPLFDGALFINTLRGQDIGLDGMEGDFDAIMEPVSLRLLSRAMGWPEFSGKLAGRIPGLSYRDGALDLAGSIEASVFDGHVTARNLRVEQPFGAWPQLHADISARNLDLALVTSTFEVGSITGRLDVDLLDLATFGATPTAFDLRMATPAKDRSRRRISQRAVESLSSIGGGGGGVAAALQSGFLRFFDEFPYARLGISCRLRNDVCHMDGAGTIGPDSFYIVRGRGLPRIDIIGNGRRVDWPRLVNQVATALDNATDVVVD